MHHYNLYKNIYNLAKRYITRMIYTGVIMDKGKENKFGDVRPHYNILCAQWTK